MKTREELIQIIKDSGQSHQLPSNWAETNSLATLNMLATLFTMKKGV